MQHPLSIRAMQKVIAQGRPGATLTKEADVANPIVLTDKDFADHEHLHGHDGLVLVLAHTNLLDEKAAMPGDSARCRHA
jgi:hypothetical protein